MDISNEFLEYFSNGRRQGPGSEYTTKLAAGFIDNIGRSLNILDVGCGAGRQTLHLAKYLRGNITAIDYFPVMLDIINKRIKDAGLCDRIKTIQCSMDNMPFKDEEFDLVWSEGAVFIVGFEKGINDWRRFIKKGGYLAVTDAAWMTAGRPDEINNYWNNCYPDIDIVSNNIKKIENAGYVPVANFALPEECWIENYYLPLQKQDEAFLKRHNYSQAAKDVVEETAQEFNMYKTYKDYYSYVFYIMKKL
jgi:ubiquinone/menaquinone biosynthesis C-methylase UbiE